jgi:hypothetical protein
MRNCVFFVHPHEFLAFVHHADETAEIIGWVFGFEQGMKFALSCAVITDTDAVFEIGCVNFLSVFYSRFAGVTR